MAVCSEIKIANVISVAENLYRFAISLQLKGCAKAIQISELLICWTTLPSVSSGCQHMLVNDCKLCRSY
jgi:hypothetical protein